MVWDKQTTEWENRIRKEDRRALSELERQIRGVKGHVKWTVVQVPIFDGEGYAAAQRDVGKSLRLLGEQIQALASKTGEPWTLVFDDISGRLKWCNEAIRATCDLNEINWPRASARSEAEKELLRNRARTKHLKAVE